MLVLKGMREICYPTSIRVFANYRFVDLLIIYHFWPLGKTCKLSPGTNLI